MNLKINTYNNCIHYRKNRVVLNYLGYSICCAGDAYIRLFAYEDLILDKLPIEIKYFPLDKMDKICKDCPFGSCENLPLEKEVGCPVSDIYKNEKLKK